MNLLKPSCGVEVVRATQDYMGATVVATKAWKKGTVIAPLVARTALIPRQDIVYGKNDFSVYKIDTTAYGKLMLGPLALVNHDCNPNAEVWNFSDHFDVPFDVKILSVCLSKI